MCVCEYFRLTIIGRALLQPVSTEFHQVRYNNSLFWHHTAFLLLSHRDNALSSLCIYFGTKKNIGKRLV